MKTICLASGYFCEDLSSKEKPAKSEMSSLQFSSLLFLRALLLQLIE